MPLDAAAATEAVAAARGLGLEEARRVFRLALLSKGEMTRTIVAEKRRLLMHNSAIDCIELGADELQGLSMVGGLDALKKWLADRRKSLSAEARGLWSPAAQGVAAAGVQGCGKSLSAKAIPAEWHMPLCRLDLSGLFSQRESPSVTLRRTIASVEAMAPIVLWIDELEKVFAGLESGRDSELMRLFGWFIMWLGSGAARSSWSPRPTTSPTFHRSCSGGVASTRPSSSISRVKLPGRKSSTSTCAGAAGIPKRCRSRPSPSEATNSPAPSWSN